jgi:glutamate-1-semialdehyde 2,1-aminomutase
MERMAPLGDVYQAGTLSGNPIAMAAGIATIKLIMEPGFFDRLTANCTRLVNGLQAAANQHGVPYSIRNVGGMAGMYFLATPPNNFAQIMSQNTERFKQFFHLMMDAGIYLPPSTVEAFFFSAAHSDDDIDFTIAAAGQAFARLAD